ncbi:hypothetical protein Y032_0691g1574 [Ancylostoma ceylanicum]|uniref:Uncharacterized protein n=1 Tax=Ancylostoma ceylanicum TaxID=53326 RepID=A0A016WHS9_9BILA|nr:hypothetical protein Y032_0691g1574 [Ancylostoma ceylanicum]
MKNKHANPEVLRLGSEVRRLRSELSLISPTAEFSTYFKTERILNKAVEQYDAAVAKEKMMQPSQVKVEMGVKVVAQAIGLYLLHTVSGIHATKARTYNAMGNAFVITSNFPPIEVNVHTDICRHFVSHPRFSGPSTSCFVFRQYGVMKDVFHQYRITRPYPCSFSSIVGLSLAEVFYHLK